MNKIIILIGCLFLIKNVFTKIENSDSPNIQILDFKVSFPENYSSDSYLKKDLEEFIPEDLKSSFPNEIKIFELQSDSKQKKDIFNCEKSVKNLRRNYSLYCKEEGIKETEKGFKNYWKKGLRLCHNKYQETVPEVKFKFHNIGSKQIICDSICIFIYFSYESYSGITEYFSNLFNEKEQIVINPDSLHTYQCFILEKNILTNNAIFSIPISFLSEEHWSGTFEKNKITIHIKFSFIDNEDGNRTNVNSEPFCIEI